MKIYFTPEGLMVDSYGVDIRLDSYLGKTLYAMYNISERPVSVVRFVCKQIKIIQHQTCGTYIINWPDGMVLIIAGSYLSVCSNTFSLS